MLQTSDRHPRARLGRYPSKRRGVVIVSNSSIESISCILPQRSCRSQQVDHLLARDAASPSELGPLLSGRGANQSEPLCKREGAAAWCAMVSTWRVDSRTQGGTCPIVGTQQRVAPEHVRFLFTFKPFEGSTYIRRIEHRLDKAR